MSHEDTLELQIIILITGILVPGITGNSSSKFCSISVLALKNSQFGKWSCKVKLAETPLLIEAIFTVTNDIRVSDVRLPGHLKPEKYAVYLTPFLVEGNFTFEASFSWFVGSC